MSKKDLESKRETQGSGCLGGCGFLLGILMLSGVLRIDRGIQIEVTEPNAVDLAELEDKAKVADRAVQKFHTQLNQGECQEVYEQTAEIYKDATDLSQWMYLCSEIKSQFGDVESTIRVDQSEQHEQGIDYFAASYDTKLSNASINEVFMWIIDLLHNRFHGKLMGFSSLFSSPTDELRSEPRPK